jgi:hypothetical protein
MVIALLVHVLAIIARLLADAVASGCQLVRRLAGADEYSLLTPTIQESWSAFRAGKPTALGSGRRRRLSGKAAADTAPVSLLAFARCVENLCVDPGFA